MYVIMVCVSSPPLAPPPPSPSYTVLPWAPPRAPHAPPPPHARHPTRGKQPLQTVLPLTRVPLVPSHSQLPCLPLRTSPPAAELALGPSTHLGLARRSLPAAPESPPAQGPAEWKDRGGGEIPRCTHPPPEQAAPPPGQLPFHVITHLQLPQLRRRCPSAAPLSTHLPIGHVFLPAARPPRHLHLLRPSCSSAVQPSTCGAPSRAFALPTSARRRRARWDPLRPPRPAEFSA